MAKQIFSRLNTKLGDLPLWAAMGHQAPKRPGQVTYKPDMYSRPTTPARTPIQHHPKQGMFDFMDPEYKEPKKKKPKKKKLPKKERARRAARREEVKAANRKNTLSRLRKAGYKKWATRGVKGLVLPYIGYELLSGIVGGQSAEGVASKSRAMGATISRNQLMRSGTHPVVEQQDAIAELKKLIALDTTKTGLQSLNQPYRAPMNRGQGAL